MTDKCEERRLENEHLVKALAEINGLIFAKGAPLGSDVYFRIREIVSEALRTGENYD
jgi:hypothetical protein